MSLLLTFAALSCGLWWLRARRRRVRVHRRRRALSPEWLSALDRQSTRIEYHGPRVHRSWK